MIEILTDEIFTTMTNFFSRRARIQFAFRWLGNGALLILFAFFGTVSANTTESATVQLSILSLAGIGAVCVIVGLFVLLMSARGNQVGLHDR